MFVYIFTPSVCKICTLQREKNRRKIVKLRTYSRSIPVRLLSCLHSAILFQLSMIPHLYHMSGLQKNTVYLAFENKGFVVFKINEWHLVVNSSDEEDEDFIKKKPKLEESFVANRDVFFSINTVPGDGHCYSRSNNVTKQW